MSAVCSEIENKATEVHTPSQFASFLEDRKSAVSDIRWTRTGEKRCEVAGEHRQRQELALGQVGVVWTSVDEVLADEAIDWQQNRRHNSNRHHTQQHHQYWLNNC